VGAQADLVCEQVYAKVTSFVGLCLAHSCKRGVWNLASLYWICCSWSLNAITSVCKWEIRRSNHWAWPYSILRGLYLFIWVGEKDPRAERRLQHGRFITGDDWSLWNLCMWPSNAWFVVALGFEHLLVTINKMRAGKCGCPSCDWILWRWTTCKLIIFTSKSLISFTAVYLAPSDFLAVHAFHLL